DWSKGASRHFLEKEERLLFAKGMALAMLYGDGSLTVSYEDIVDNIIKIIPQLSKERRDVLINQTEEVCTDVRVCSFLRIVEGSRFQFIHKSFMEYLVADQIHDDLHSDGRSEILRANLNYEILYFLGAFVLLEGDLVDILSDNASDDYGETYKRNVIGGMLYSGKVIRKIEVGHCTIDRLKFKSLAISESILRGIKFSEVVATDIAFESCSLLPCVMDNVQTESVRVRRCSGRLLLQNLDVPLFDVANSPRLALTAVQCGVSVCKVSGVKQFNLGDYCRMGSLNIDRACLVLMGNRGGDGDIETAMFDGVRLKSEVGRDGSMYRKIHDVQFRACKFEGFHYYIDNSKDIQMSGCAGLVFLHANKDGGELYTQTLRRDGSKARRRWAFRFGVLFLDQKLYGNIDLKVINSLYARLAKRGSQSEIMRELDELTVDQEKRGK
ncbi:MAG: hypothetical protein WB764_27480, partial [Xanthobacteraceae bacterium]